jgi:hypothetical protein
MQAQSIAIAAVFNAQRGSSDVDGSNVVGDSANGSNDAIDGTGHVLKGSDVEGGNVVGGGSGRVLKGFPDEAGRRAAAAATEAKLPRLCDAHRMGKKQWNYTRSLLTLAGIDMVNPPPSSSSASLSFSLPLPSSDRSFRLWLATNEALYNHVGDRRPAFPGAPDSFRGLEYTVVNDYVHDTAAKIDGDGGGFGVETWQWQCQNEADIDALVKRDRIGAVDGGPEWCK